jgi:hypothetical protein
MTEPAPAPGGPPARDDLTPRLFRALFQGFDLHQAGGTYVVLPKGTPRLAGPSLGAIARQISTRDPAPGPNPAGPGR